MSFALAFTCTPPPPNQPPPPTTRPSPGETVAIGKFANGRGFFADKGLAEGEPGWPQFQRKEDGHRTTSDGGISPKLP